MGIKGLWKFITENTADTYTEHDISDFSSRVIAIDASVLIYQFLVAIRQADGSQLCSASGEVTSHIVGMLSRMLGLREAGVKPVFVFDGEPPALKASELHKRRDAKSKAADAAAAARATGDEAAAISFDRRTVHMEQKHIDDCVRLLTLCGIPVLVAPCEAESQAAALARAGRVWGVASEDLDTITHCTPRFIRGLTMSAAERTKKKIVQVQVEDVHKAFGMTPRQFVDFSILLGCDYTSTIVGIGPKKAYEYISKFGSIEGIIDAIQRNEIKATVPEDFNYEGAREMFEAPKIMNPSEVPPFQWKTPDVKGLTDFLLEKGFSPVQIQNAVNRMQKLRVKPTQNRLDSFFNIQTKHVRNPRMVIKSGSDISSVAAKALATSTAINAREAADAASRTGQGRKAGSDAMQRRAAMSIAAAQGASPLPRKPASPSASPKPRAGAARAYVNLDDDDEMSDVRAVRYERDSIHDFIVSDD